MRIPTNIDCFRLAFSTTSSAESTTSLEKPNSLAIVTSLTMLLRVLFPAPSKSRSERLLGIMLDRFELMNGIDKAPIACSKFLAPRTEAASIKDPGPTTGAIAFAKTACSLALVAVLVDILRFILSDPRRFVAHFLGGRTFPKRSAFIVGKVP